MNIFNRKLLTLHREKIQSFTPSIKKLIEGLYLDLFEKLDAHFPHVLNIGFNQIDLENLPIHCSIGKVINADIAIAPLSLTNSSKILIDFEDNLPFKENIFDLIISIGVIHYINDVKKFLSSIKNILKPNGIFIATFAGGDTLIELKKSFIAAELNSSIDCRVPPFIEVKDAGKLMQNIGFGLSVSESEIINIQYQSLMQLFIDIKSLAESNILNQKISALTKNKMAIMEEYYKNNFFDKNNSLFNVTLNLITVTGIK